MVSALDPAVRYCHFCERPQRWVAIDREFLDGVGGRGFVGELSGAGCSACGLAIVARAEVVDRRRVKRVVAIILPGGRVFTARQLEGLCVISSPTLGDLIAAARRAGERTNEAN